MGFYRNQCIPCMIRLGCARPAFDAQRTLVVPRASGRVLEIGVGPGFNLRYYDAAKVSRVVGIEPNHGMRRIASDQIHASKVPFDWVQGSAVALPFRSRSFDSVVVTFTLCSVPELPRVLAEMYRVLDDAGGLYFCEHGIAPDPGVRVWQNRLTPLWKIISDGCHLNRDVYSSLAGAGFRMAELEQYYLKDVPRIGGFVYRGIAVKS